MALAAVAGTIGSPSLQGNGVFSSPGESEGAGWRQTWGIGAGVLPCPQSIGSPRVVRQTRQARGPETRDRLAEREWMRAELPAEAGDTAWAGRSPVSRFALRPLSLGEILDRIFTLYRSRFWLFAGISMIAAAVQTVAQAISLTTAQRLAARTPAPPGQGLGAALLGLREASAAQLPAYLVLLVFFLVSAVTQAGTALALTQVYMHRATGVRLAMGQVLPRWYRWIGIALWQVGSMVWAPVAAAVPAVLLLGFGVRLNNTGLIFTGGFLLLLAVFGGFPVGVLFYLRNGLATPAAVTEGLSIRAAMRRSKVLAAGAKGRVFVVLLIAGSLLEVAAVLQLPISFLMIFAPHQQHSLARGIGLLITFTGHTLVAPVALIGLTLVYFDQRVRKEALDLELLLESARVPPPAPVGLAQPEGYAPLR